MNQSHQFIEVYVRRRPHKLSVQRATHKNSCTLQVQIIKFEMSLTLQTTSFSTVLD